MFSSDTETEGFAATDATAAIDGRELAARSLTPGGIGGERLRYKEALVETLKGLVGEFHVVAQLRPGASRAALEDSLYAWVARVDRHYLGRSWSAPYRADERMRGAVFFETGGGYDHAHLVVRAPAGASRFRFLHDAPFFFQPHPEPAMRRFFPRPVAPGAR